MPGIFWNQHKALRDLWQEMILHWSVKCMKSLDSLLHVDFPFVYKRNFSEKTKPEISLSFITMQNNIKECETIRDSWELKAQPGCYFWFEVSNQVDFSDGLFHPNSVFLYLILYA